MRATLSCLCLLFLSFSLLKGEEGKCVMVTGGSGYLGRNVIRSLLKQNINVKAIGRSEKSRDTITELGAQAYPGDLTRTDLMAVASQGCDLIIHCAASVSQFDDIETMRKINVQGTRNVMEAAIQAGVKRVVHVGTEAACVPHDGGPIVNLDESTPLPSPPFPGVYSTTKNEAERAALSYNGDKLEVVVVRPRLIWGKDDTVVLAGFVEAAESGVLKWFDGGQYLTSTCHVDNVVEGIELAASVGKPGESYFLTDGAPVEFRTFVSKMLGAVDVVPPSSEVPLSLLWGVATVAEGVCSVLGCEPLITKQTLVLVGQEVTVNDSKARNEMGYVGHVSIEEGMRDLRERNVNNKNKNKAEL
uniref:3-beta hydroxysteroid dehydrogenase/isomerase domain-containing protein n=1 Tax=Paramoeba aestuarina TaxID=180227 RepID=A0A7S4P629_9EUKA|mmetsp:Transcript_36899/g.58006  ORF Transcript_36899/g.58006 Transcript_36899/m.58006 type:complete len:359 (+) Transcript_36899:91-1167(+)